MKTKLAVPQRFDRSLVRHALASSLWLLTLVAFWEPIKDLIHLSLQDDRSSHIVVIPLISAFLIWIRRTQIFSGNAYCPSAGVILLLALVLWHGLPLHSLSPIDRLSVAASLLVAVWIAIFLLFYGAKAFQTAVFPLCFLLLMIPLPSAAIERFVLALQKGSAEVSYSLFRLGGMPVVRTSLFRFSLPGVDIEIAGQCSSIRSSISLFLTSLLAGHMFLESIWKRTILSLLAIPIAILKNAIRIVTISWLGVYESRGFFHGALHLYGGLAFSLVALALLGITLFLLRRPFLLKATGG